MLFRGARGVLGTMKCTHDVLSSSLRLEPENETAIPERGLSVSLQTRIKYIDETVALCGQTYRVRLNGSMLNVTIYLQQ